MEKFLVGLVVALLLSGCAARQVSGTALVEVNINGAYPIAHITHGEPWSFSWSTKGVSACSVVTPKGATPLLSLSGTSDPITVGHPLYPMPGTETMIIVSCTKGSRIVSNLVRLKALPRQ